MTDFLVDQVALYFNTESTGDSNSTEPGEKKEKKDTVTVVSKNAGMAISIWSGISWIVEKLKSI